MLATHDINIGASHKQWPAVEVHPVPQWEQTVHLDQLTKLSSHFPHNQPLETVDAHGRQVQCAWSLEKSPWCPDLNPSRHGWELGNHPKVNDCLSPELWRDWRDYPSGRQKRNYATCRQFLGIGHWRMDGSQQCRIVCGAWRLHGHSSEGTMPLVVHSLE